MIIQEKNGINLTNIDIAKITSLACHDQDGIIANRYEECKLELNSVKLTLHSGEIIASGYLITVKDNAYVSIDNKANGNYHIILKICVGKDKNVKAEIYYTKNSTLTKDDILTNEYGIYMIEIGTFECKTMLYQMLNKH